MPCTSSISIPSYQAEVVGTTPDPGSRTRPQASSQSRTRGLRLSWPNAGDKRRSRVGKSPVAQNYPQQTRIVHVSSRDLQMHYHFNSPTAASIPPPILEVPLTAWNPANLNTGEQELLHHFQSATSRSLAIVGYDPEELGDALIRITLASNTPAATAVLRSLLALASLHRDGMQTQAVEFKIAALKALAAPSASTSEPIEAIQRVAAGMLLVSFETHQSSCTSADWTLYLGTVKDVIKAADFFVGYMDPDLAIILDWVYYHDVLARFSLRHWHKDSTKGIPTWDSSKPEIFGGRGFNSVSSFPEIGTFRTTMSQLYPGAPVPPHLTLLELMSEVCDAVSAPRLRRKGSQSVSSRGSSRSATTSKSSSPTRSPSAEDDLLSYEDNEHKSFLQILDWRIRTLSLFPDQEHNTPASDLDEATQQCNLIAELYQLSTLIYLSRASEGLLFSSASTTSRGSKPSTMNNQNKLQSYITKAFSVLPSVKSCPRQFPVFILGAEAHSDENRALILDLISRTEKGAESRSFNHVRVLLQAIWAQHDLSNDGIAAGGGGGTAKDAGQWGYWDKMSYVISCCRIVPSFV